MRLITGDAIWSSITSLATKAPNGSRFVAVAYISDGASQMLPLGKGDLLLSDCTPHSARHGATNPHEVEKYTKAGVEVYHWEGLHAKVFVLGDVAVVGSTNASRSSRDDLLEAVVVLSGKAQVTAARRFVEDHCLDPVDADWLELCKRNWKPPKFRPRSRPLGSWTPIPSGSAWRMWCIGTSNDYEWPAYVSEAVRQHHKSVRAQARFAYRLETLIWDSRPRFRKGDLVIERCTEDGRDRAYPPAQVADVWAVRRGNSERILATLMRPQRLRSIADNRLIKAGKEAGLVLRDVGEQEIKKPEHRAALMTFWPELSSVSVP